MNEVLKKLIAERGEGGKLTAQVVVEGAMVQGVIEEMGKSVFRAVAMMPKDPHNPRPGLDDLMVTETWFAGDACRAVIIPASDELADGFKQLIESKKPRIHRV